MPSQLHLSVCQELLDYVVRMNFNHYEGEITIETPLLQSGIVDSLSMMTFILFLEQRYGLDFFETEITRQDFRTIATLAALVVTQLEGAAASTASVGQPTALP